MFLQAFDIADKHLVRHASKTNLLDAKKEVSKFAELTIKMHKKSNELINELEVKKRNKLMKKIIKYEEITDNLESEIVNYLGNVSSSKLTDKSSLRLRSMLSITSDLERIGDIYMQI